MFRLSVLSFVLLGSVLVYAQTAPAPAAAPTTGPSMEQTIDFINQTIQQEGVVTKKEVLGPAKYFQGKVVLQSGCHLGMPKERVGYDDDNITVSGEGKYIIDLTRLDPRTISFGASEYGYLIYAKATYSIQQLDSPLSDDVGKTVAGSRIDFSVQGTVSSVQDDHHFTLTPLSPGPDISFVISDKKTVWMADMQKANKAQGGEVGEIQDTSFKKGDVLDVSYNAKDIKKALREATFISIDSKREDNDKSRDVMLFVAPDHDVAQHVAKAFIHAAALCYQAPAPPPAAPSLF